MNTFPARILCLLLAFGGVSALAVNRTVTITAPTEAPAGSTVPVTVLASTDAADGEGIGFLHSEFSTDGGKTWSQFCYAMKCGTEFSRRIDFPVGDKGVKTIIRMRVAFRGGKAGDVDFMGAPILWDSTWEKWRKPPAKFAIIYVN